MSNLFTPDDFLKQDQKVESQDSMFTGEDFGVQEKAKPQQEEESDLLGAAGRGMQGALAGWSMSPEDFAASDTLGEGVTEAAVNLGTSLGAMHLAGLGGAKAGAAIGTAFPGAGNLVGGGAGYAIGALIYGLYAAWGDEKSRSAYENQDFSEGRMAARTFMEVNPILKTAGKVSKIVRLASQVGAAGGVEYSYNKDMDAALVTAGITTLFTPLMWKSMSGSDAPLTSKHARAILDDIQSPEGLDLLNRAAKRAENFKSPDFSDPKALPDDFKRYVTFSPTRARVEEVDSRFDEVIRTEAKLEDLWKQYAFHKSMLAEAEESNDKMAKQLATLDGDIGAIREWLYDPHFMARGWDEKLGDNIQGEIFDEASKAQNKFQTAAKPFLTRAIELNSQGRKGKLDPKQISRWVMGAEEVPEAHREVVQGWRGLFDDLRLEIENSGGLELGVIPNYLPRRMMRGADLAHAVEQKIEHLNKIKGAKGYVPDQTLGELRNIWKIYNPKDPFNMKDLAKLPKMIIHSGKTSMQYDVSAAYKRRAPDIPEWAKEMDIGKLLQSYIYSNFRGIYTDKLFRNLNTRIEVMDALGLDKSANYLRRYKEHMSGISTGFDSEVQAFANQMRKTGLKWADKSGLFKKGVSVPMRHAIDIVSWVNAQVYPAYLGLNTRAHLRNLTQNFTVTAPEIGGKYGYELVTRGVLSTAKRFGAANPDEIIKMFRNKDPALLKRLQELGQEGAFTRTEILTAQETLPGGSAAKKLVDATNDGLMAAYTYTDVINRNIAYDAGMSWAKDVVSKRPDAVAALRKLSAGRKAQIRASGAFKIKDPDKQAEVLGDLLGDYLISRTQFRYGREQLNQFGRSFGPLFSAFTKWPAMVGSDVAYEMGRLGKEPVDAAARLTGKYLAPYLALTAVQGMHEESQNRNLNYLVGTDVRDMLPSASLFSASLTGGPTVQMISEGLQATTEALKGKKTPGELAAGAAENIGTSYFPPFSSMMNEMDRIEKARRSKKPTEKMSDEIRQAIDQFLDEID